MQNGPKGNEGKEIYMQGRVQAEVPSGREFRHEAGQVGLRWAGTWGLCCSAVPGHTPALEQNTRKAGPHVTVCLHGWDNFGQKIHKDQKSPTAKFDESGAKTNHQSHPSSLTSGPTPTLIPVRDQLAPLHGVNKRTWYLFSLPSTAAGVQ